MFRQAWTNRSLAPGRGVNMGANKQYLLNTYDSHLGHVYMEDGLYLYAGNFPPS